MKILPNQIRPRPSGKFFRVDTPVPCHHKSGFKPKTLARNDIACFIAHEISARPIKPEIAGRHPEKPGLWLSASAARPFSMQAIINGADFNPGPA